MRFLSGKPPSFGSHHHLTLVWCLALQPESESADRLHKRFKSSIDENNPFTHALLMSHPRYPFHMEENMHPSGSVFSTGLALALLPTWDEDSGSQPCKTDRMLARPPREGLDTLSQRKWITIAVCSAYRVTHSCLSWNVYATLLILISL